MTPFATDLLRLFCRDLRCFIREVEAFPDDATLFRTVPGISNSAGNLALHVAGNLRHFVGGLLGHSGYQRNRELELTQREGSRAEVIATLEAAIVEVERGLDALSAETLEAPYPQLLSGHQLETRRFLMHLAVHLGFHLGQAGYLRRTLTEENASAGGMAIQELLA